MRLPILLCLAALASATPAWSDPIQDCFVERGSEADRTIQGCTGLLQMERFPQQRLPLVYARRAEAYAAKNDFEHAIADYTESLRLKEDANVFYRRGNVYRKLKQLDQAIADYDKASALDPKSTAAASARASTYDEKGDKERAIAEYAKLLETDPNNATIWSIWKSLSFGICASGTDAAAAIRACSALIGVPEQQRDPPQRISEIYFFRGFRYDKRGATREALADYNASIRADPKNARPYKMRAILYLNAKQPALSIADISAVIELNPRDGDAYKMRGALQLAGSQFDRAIADFDRASALKPQDASILVQRARAPTTARATRIAPPKTIARRWN